jgi:hypothetical protein
LDQPICPSTATAAAAAGAGARERERERAQGRGRQCAQKRKQCFRFSADHVLSGSRRLQAAGTAPNGRLGSPRVCPRRPHPPRGPRPAGVFSAGRLQGGKSSREGGLAIHAAVHRIASHLVIWYNQLIQSIENHDSAPADRRRANGVMLAAAPAPACAAAPSAAARRPPRSRRRRLARAGHLRGRARPRGRTGSGRGRSRMTSSAGRYPRTCPRRPRPRSARADEDGDVGGGIGSGVGGGVGGALVTLREALVTVQS